MYATRFAGDSSRVKSTSLTNHGTNVTAAGHLINPHFNLE